MHDVKQEAGMVGVKNSVLLAMSTNGQHVHSAGFLRADADK